MTTPSVVYDFTINSIKEWFIKTEFLKENAEFIKEFDDYTDFYYNGDITDDQFYKLFLVSVEGGLTDEVKDKLTDKDNLLILIRVLEHLEDGINYSIYKVYKVINGVELYNGVIDWDKVYRFYMYITARYHGDEDFINKIYN